MRTFKTLSSALLMTGALPILGAQGAPLAPQAIDPGHESALLTQAQYRLGGREYCFYEDGWRGPGWYRCGYRLRFGYGWGGPRGWHGFREEGRGRVGVEERERIEERGRTVGRGRAGIEERGRVEERGRTMERRGAGVEERGRTEGRGRVGVEERGRTGGEQRGRAGAEGRGGPGSTTGRGGTEGGATGRGGIGAHEGGGANMRGGTAGSGATGGRGGGGTSGSSRPGEQ